jgi:hypothetical protein
MRFQPGGCVERVEAHDLHGRLPPPNLIGNRLALFNLGLMLIYK